MANIPFSTFGYTNQHVTGPGRGYVQSSKGPPIGYDNPEARRRMRVRTDEQIEGMRVPAYEMSEAGVRENIVETKNKAQKLINQLNAYKANYEGISPEKLHPGVRSIIEKLENKIANVLSEVEGYESEMGSITEGKKVMSDIAKEEAKRPQLDYSKTPEGYREGLKSKEEQAKPKEIKLYQQYKEKNPNVKIDLPTFINRINRKGDPREFLFELAQSDARVVGDPYTGTTGDPTQLKSVFQEYLKAWNETGPVQKGVKVSTE